MSSDHVSIYAVGRNFVAFVFGCIKTLQTLYFFTRHFALRYVVITRLWSHVSLDSRRSVAILGGPNERCSLSVINEMALSDDFTASSRLRRVYIVCVAA